MTDKLGPRAAGKSIHNTGGATPTKQYEPQQTPDEREAELFARDIAAVLLKGQQDGHFKKLLLIAEPKFLGVLRVALDPHVKSLVTLEINKDLTHSSGHQLREQLQALKDKQSSG